MGLDGLGVWLFGLSALLMVSAVLVSWEAIEDRAALFYGMLLLLECGCLGVFAARDILLFYIFFEFTLIPLFFLIGIWGSEQLQYAARKFFVYTLAGSLLTLGFRCLLPGGAFYVWPNVSEACRMVGAKDSEELRKLLLYEADVAVLADIHFGTPIESEGQHVRFSYASSLDAIDQGLERVAAFMKRRTR